MFSRKPLILTAQFELDLKKLDSEYLENLYAAIAVELRERDSKEPSYESTL